MHALASIHHIPQHSSTPVTISKAERWLCSKLVIQSPQLMALGRSKRSVQAMVRKFVFDCCSCLLCLFPMYRSLLILVLPIDTGMLVIESTQWKLANDCIPTFFIKADAPRHTPGVVKVEDPYLVIGVNDIVITHCRACKCQFDTHIDQCFIYMSK